MMKNLQSMRVGPQVSGQGNRILEKLGRQLEETFNRTVRDINPQNPNESFHQSDLSFKSHQIEENDNKEFLEEVSGDNNAGNFSFHNSPVGGASSHHLTPTSNNKAAENNIFDNKLIKNLNDSFSNQNFGGSNNKVYILIHRTASI